MRRGVARPASCSLWAAPTLRPPRSPAIWPAACAAGSRRCWPTGAPTRRRGCATQLTGLADAPAEQFAGGATVIGLDTPLARAWRAHRAGGAGEASRMKDNRSDWMVGADRMAPRGRSGEVVPMPSGRLHAVGGAGLIVGRALCLGPGDPAGSA